MSEIYHKDLSYQIMGVLFGVHRQLGSRYQEKYYQRAVALAFDKNNIKYEKELKVDLVFDNKIIGKYFLDFLVEKQIVVELKAVNKFISEDIKQVLGYLKAKNLKLGILVNFRANSLQYRRILNSQY
jgi:GxxExxY protein